MYVDAIATVDTVATGHATTASAKGHAQNDVNEYQCTKMLSQQWTLWPPARRQPLLQRVMRKLALAIIDLRRCYRRSGHSGHRPRDNRFCKGSCAKRRWRKSMYVGAIARVDTVATGHATTDRAKGHAQTTLVKMCAPRGGMPRDSTTPQRW